MRGLIHDLGEVSFRKPLLVIVLVSFGVISVSSPYEVFARIDISDSTSDLVNGITFSDPNLKAELISTGLELIDPDGHSSVRWLFWVQMISCFGQEWLPSEKDIKWHATAQSAIRC
jgi:hypothetical protein